MNEEKARENMDAFKELMRQVPSLEVATLEELKTISIFSKTAAQYGRALIMGADKLPDNPRLARQSQIWLEDSQRAMETHMLTEAERGKRAKKEPQSPVGPAVRSGDGSAVNRAPGPSHEDPKWRRLGFDSESEMVQAEFLDSHRDTVHEVVAKAKDEKDVPSKGAVKETVKRKKAETARADYEQRMEGVEIDTRLLARGEAAKYLSKFREVVHILPAKVPSEGWNEESFAEANAMAKIVRSRLEVWNDSE